MYFITLMKNYFYCYSYNKYDDMSVKLCVNHANPILNGYSSYVPSSSSIHLINANVIFHKETGRQNLLRLKEDEINMTLSLWLP